MVALWVGIGVLVSLGGLSVFLVARYGPEVLGREVPGSHWIDLLLFVHEFWWLIPFVAVYVLVMWLIDSPQKIS